MGIEVDVKRKFVVNGKEYASLDALPSDIRETLQKTLKEDKSRVEVNIDTSIVFNGKEYTGADRMPAETRQTYEKLMKAAGTGDFASHALNEIGAGKKASFSFNAKTPGATFSFSLGPVFAVLIVIALAAGFYFLFM